MTKSIVLIFLFSLGSALCAGNTPNPADARVSLDRFIARVNDRVITYGDVLLAAHEYEIRIRTQVPPESVGPQIRELYQRSLQLLVDRALILEEAARRQAQLDERAIDDYISQIIRDQFGNDRTAFLQALAQDQVSLSTFRERTRENLLISLMRRQEISERVRVSPRELRDAYDRQIDLFRQPEEIKLSVILIHRGETEADRQAKREQVRRVEERLRAREDFAAVARETSEGFGAAAGGSWDWIRASDVTEELREPVARMSPGDISPIIETDPWFFLVRLDARRPERITPFEEVRHQVEMNLVREAEEAAYRRWIEVLSARHTIVRLSEPWIETP